MNVDRTAGPGAGLYVHVPFCLTRCGYCDFNTYAGLDGLRSPYVGALMREADVAAPGWSGERFVSLFLGGGTPTTLAAGELATLLGRLRERFALTEGAEITTEANPDTVDRAYLAEIRNAAGIGRLSMGLQSFDPQVLRALERLHSAEAAVAAFAAARAAGFDNINLDLIYGAPGETLSSWRRTLDRTLSLGPEHVSAYALTIEPTTPLGRKVAAGAPAPDPDLQADMYLAACDALARAGYEHYEVSNWALPGRRCVHNLGYWQGRPYLGLGAGAHSFRGDRRWWNLRPPQAYIDAAARGVHALAGEERLNGDERRLERFLLGLRLSDGVPAAWVEPPDLADEFVEGGLAERDGGRLRLTERGMFLANDVVLELAAGRESRVARSGG